MVYVETKPGRHKNPRSTSRTICSVATRFALSTRVNASALSASAAPPKFSCVGADSRCRNGLWSEDA